MKLTATAMPAAVRASPSHHRQTDCPGAGEKTGGAGAIPLDRIAPVFSAWADVTDRRYRKQGYCAQAEEIRPAFSACWATASISTTFEQPRQMKNMGMANDGQATVWGDPDNVKSQMDDKALVRGFIITR